MFDSIRLSAYNQETESYRIDRLMRVVGYVAALSEHYGNPEMLNRIIQIHDHKGELTVVWNGPATPGETEFFDKAWKSHIGDYSDNVIHTFVGG